jgi:single-strand DNA-binding protein
MIRLEVIGHLGRDAEVKTLEDGRTVVNFSVAHSEKWKDKQTGEQQEKSTWVTCSKWFAAGTNATVAQYLKKGTQVFVAGTCEARGFKAREQSPDGSDQIKGELVLTIGMGINDLQLLGGQGSGQGQAGNQPPAAKSAPPPPPPQPKWDQQKGEWIKPELVNGKWQFPGESSTGNQSSAMDDLPF